MQSGRQPHAREQFALPEGTVICVSPGRQPGLHWTAWQGGAADGAVSWFALPVATPPNTHMPTNSKDRRAIAIAAAALGSSRGDAVNGGAPP